MANTDELASTAACLDNEADALEVMVKRLRHEAEKLRTRINKIKLNEQKQKQKAKATEPKPDPMRPVEEITKTAFEYAIEKDPTYTYTKGFYHIGKYRSESKIKELMDKISMIVERDGKKYQIKAEENLTDEKRYSTNAVIKISWTPIEEINEN